MRTHDGAENANQILTRRVLASSPSPVMNGERLSIVKTTVGYSVASLPDLFVSGDKMRECALDFGHSIQMA